MGLFGIDEKSMSSGTFDIKADLTVKSVGATILAAASLIRFIPLEDSSSEEAETALYVLTAPKTVAMAPIMVKNPTTFSPKILLRIIEYSRF